MVTSGRLWNALPDNIITARKRTRFCAKGIRGCAVGDWTFCLGSMNNNIEYILRRLTIFF